MPRAVPLVLNWSDSHQVETIDAPSRLLIAQQRQSAITKVTTVLGYGIPLATRGELVAIHVDDELDVRGIVNAVQITVTFGVEVEQTISIGGDVPNRWAAFRGPRKIPSLEFFEARNENCDFHFVSFSSA